MQRLSLNPYNTYYSHNVSSKGYSPVDICSKLCKGACCDHSTVLSMPLKRATDRLMGEFFKSSVESRTHLPLKRIVYSWGLNTQDSYSLAINRQINDLISEMQETTIGEKVQALSNKIDELNKELASRIDNKAEIFLPITNQEFKDDPKQAVTSNLPNVCMYKDPETNKCTIYHGLTTSEGEIIQRPNPCHIVGSEAYPCPWLNPEKTNFLLSRTKAMFAQQGYQLSEDVVVNYIREQHNLNKTWEDLIYKPYLDSIGVKY